MHEAPAPHRTIRLDEYRPPDYRIETVNLEFDLHPDHTRVKSLLTVVCNYDRATGMRPLVLDGKALALKVIQLDGRPLGEGDYTLSEGGLVIPQVPEQFVLAIETEISPRENTELAGLYLSGNGYYTQCEAEGFRKITYYPDRPDVMARFFTTIAADAAACPVLLSNGNLIGSGLLPDGRRFAKWHDPFPKPAYLFALVAGDLARIEDSFTTRSGRSVALHIYVQHHNREKCGHAMESLKQAMRWDEGAYGREYDLDTFMIVAVDDFNMGAMENKGLNIFNSKYVLARPETATDADFQGITAVVGHEYFHNWSGDRVTCRDWFQLSLKEGFTVFRDQHFMEDVASAGVERINDVNVLRTHQFREDAGPLAHPVRPASYVEINNFYTLTVYNKGAEVIRMLRTLLGPEGFRKGTDLYFARHDGQAVTTDDFVRAMEDATGADLARFRLWYSQAGTPELSVSRAFDPAAKTYTLVIRQSCPATPGQPDKKPMHIPVALGLVGKDGTDLALRLADGREAAGTMVLDLRKPEETFVFTGIAEEPVPSMLRGFSAPVKVKLDLTDRERLFLMAHDSDALNRWDAGQQLAIQRVLGLIRDIAAGSPLALDRAFIDAYRATLFADLPDKALQAALLTLPAENYIADFLDVVDPAAIFEARRFILQTLAKELEGPLFAVYQTNKDDGPYRRDQEAMGRRSIKNAALALLMEGGSRDAIGLCNEQFRNAGNMTDQAAALACLANTDCAERHEALAAFFEHWQGDPLVMDKWLSIQALSRLPGTLARVKELTANPVFTIRNPNKVRALIGAFAANPVRFHDASGAGYAFVTDHILQIDPLNPQIAARLATPLTLWKRYEEGRRTLMRIQLERIAAASPLSRDLYEVASKSLT